MSTATPAKTPQTRKVATPPQTARPEKRAPAQEATAASPGEMPKHLLDAGWELKDHVGEGGDRFQCVHKASGRVTSPYLLPQEAIAAAEKAEAKLAATQNAKQLTGQGDPVALDRMPISVRESRVLPVPLKPDEINAKLDEWVEKEARKAAIERESKEVADGYKGQVTKLASEIAHVQQVLREREEEREVETVDRMDYENATVRMVRLDTNEQYDTRPMTQEELKQSQHRIPGV